MALWFPRESSFFDWPETSVFRGFPARLGTAGTLTADPMASGELMPRGGTETLPFIARLDFTEEDNQYKVHMDLPGMSKDEVNVEIRDNILNISGERKFSRDTKDDRSGQRITERRYGRFCRSIRLPDDTNTAEASAKMDNGVLELVFAKSAPGENVKKITVV
ncbi:hypothetical protein HDU76_006422 [Blyttiomyces sp. JEL0837]|nr:hypothetical protein HDU76_006422 [Blyttiomyces sp. JEL0837]